MLDHPGLSPAVSSVFTLPLRPRTIERMQVREVYLEGQIDLRALRKRHADSRVLSADPLILEVPPAGFIAATKFGGVAFWNCGVEAQRTWLSRIREAMGPGSAELLDDSNVAYPMSSTLTLVLNQRRSWQLKIAVIALILLEVVIVIGSLAR